MTAFVLAALLAVAPEAKPAPAAQPQATQAAPQHVRTVKLAVTKKGFVPDKVKVKKGEPLRLLVTRKTEQTCATEIEIEDTKISQDLPLNKEVEVDYTPTKSGEVRYACSMGMVSGVLLVE
jgi:plastocyanin domain-containing protein